MSTKILCAFVLYTVMEMAIFYSGDSGYIIIKLFASWSMIYMLTSLYSQNSLSKVFSIVFLSGIYEKHHMRQRCRISKGLWGKLSFLSFTMCFWKIGEFYFKFSSLLLTSFFSKSMKFFIYIFIYIYFLIFNFTSSKFMPHSPSLVWAKGPLYLLLEWHTQFSDRR